MTGEIHKLLGPLWVTKMPLSQIANHAVAFARRLSDEYDTMLARTNGKAGPYSVAQLARAASNADLGLAILVAEDPNDDYEPIDVVMSVREALESCVRDYRARLDEVHDGGDPLCPAWYILWARDEHGKYRALHRIDPEGLA